MAAKASLSRLWMASARLLNLWQLRASAKILNVMILLSRMALTVKLTLRPSPPMQSRGGRVIFKHLTRLHHHQMAGPAMPQPMLGLAPRRPLT